jgi:tetrapyrrole methylase family protein/MazG family protein
VNTAAGRIVVVGLGPAGPEHVPPAVRAALDATTVHFLRTRRHPAASIVEPATSFDATYEHAATLDEVYRTIVDALVEAATTHGHVLYAVPGSPAVAERTVALLRADGRALVEVIPAMSFLDVAWARLGVDPIEAGVRVVDGHRFAVEAAGERGPLLVAQCDSRAVLSDIKLAADPSPTIAVTVLQRLGLDDERITTLQWDDLDREIVADHLTSLWIPELAAPVAREVTAAVELSRHLRDRCPWDREQTHASLVPYLLEEAYETVEAVQHLNDGQDGYAHLEEELGDLFYQVVFHSTLAAEAGQFTLADVARGIHDKLVRRHPHVFGDVDAATSGEVIRNWEELKRAEKGRRGVFDGVPTSLPGLLYAAKVQARASAIGFDWDAVDQVYPKVEEELAELRAAPSEDELGDLLFAVVNVARHLAIDPEVAARRAAGKFRTRFEAVERLATDRGLELAALDLAALDGLWDEIKETDGGS